MWSLRRRIVSGGEIEQSWGLSVEEVDLRAMRTRPLSLPVSQKVDPCHLIGPSRPTPRTCPWNLRGKKNR
jgi:hypothetical protein